MTAVQTAGDLERKRLREVNGYREAIQKTDDSLTLKPVELTTAAAYKKTLHEWNLYVHFRRVLRQEKLCSNSRIVSLKITLRSFPDAHPVSSMRRRRKTFSSFIRKEEKEKAVSVRRVT